jgi:hypothetical protein
MNEEALWASKLVYDVWGMRWSYIDCPEIQWANGYTHITATHLTLNRITLAYTLMVINEAPRLRGYKPMHCIFPVVLDAVPR